MKDAYTDANFPRTADGRVYHLGLRTGEVANRIITVGSPSRAQALSTMLDESSDASRKVFTVISERGFITYTGRFGGVPVSIVSIGMGYPNMDFFVREVRECVQGDMVIIRLGSCGGLAGLPVGSVVVPKAAVSIQRNYDYEFNGEAEGSSYNHQRPYRISKPAHADPELHGLLQSTLSQEVSPDDGSIHMAADVVNASADSFYSTQGRLTSFPDHNETLIDELISTVPGLASLEMETHHLFHLASVWHPPKSTTEAQQQSDPPPLTSKPTTPAILESAGSKVGPTGTEGVSGPGGSMTLAQSSHVPTPRIRAAAAQMIFADRQSRAFISPERTSKLETWTGRAALKTLCAISIPPENMHNERGSVWEK